LAAPVLILALGHGVALERRAVQAKIGEGAGRSLIDVKAGPGESL
jgi:hypothetical protein